MRGRKKAGKAGKGEAYTFSDGSLLESGNVEEEHLLLGRKVRRPKWKLGLGM